MRKSVATVWFAFNTPFEGYCDYMYLDIKGLVTTGVGNLIDPIEMAIPLPWQRRDGSMASEGEIRAAWNTVKGHQELTHKGGVIYRRFTGLRLSRASVEAMVRRRLFANDAIMRGRFAHWDAWPADGQLGTLSISWAVGPHFHWPKLEAAAAKQDFLGMAAESAITGNAPRSAAQKQLFENAAKVVRDGLDPETILYAVQKSP